MKVLDESVFGDLILAPRPWPHALLHACFRPDRVAELEGDFPTVGFHWFIQYQLARAQGDRESEERHRIMHRTLVDMGATGVDRRFGEVAEVWVDLARDLDSKELRERLSELTGRDIRDSPMRADFWRYMPGAAFQPHIDKPHKAVTVLLYLSGRWPESGGGELVLLESPEAEPVVELAPVTGAGAVFPYVPTGWHGVRRLSPEYAQERRGIQAWYWSGAEDC